jgi:hypothetical protein
MPCQVNWTAALAIEYLPATLKCCGNLLGQPRGYAARQAEYQGGPSCLVAAQEDSLAGLSRDRLLQLRHPPHRYRQARRVCCRNRPCSPPCDWPPASDGRTCARQMPATRPALELTKEPRSANEDPAADRAATKCEAPLVHDYRSGLGCLGIEKVRFLMLSGKEHGGDDGDPYEREGHPVRVGKRVRGLG